jgi:hypothetical protein
VLTAYLPLLLSALALIISVFSFFYHRAYIKTRTSQERILAEMREEVNGILKSINETTDRDISLIEEREKTLRNLLEEIEKRLKVYVRELEVRRGAENAYRELGKNRYRFPQDSLRESDLRSKSDSQRESVLRSESEPPREPDSRDEAEPRGVKQNRPSREAAPQIKPAFPVPEFEIKAESAPDKPAENPPPVPPVGEQIFSLVKAGFSVPSIASRLGISIAEVEFAAALLERRDAQ